MCSNTKPRSACVHLFPLDGQQGVGFHAPARMQNSSVVACKCFQFHVICSTFDRNDNFDAG